MKLQSVPRQNANTSGDHFTSKNKKGQYKYV